VSGSVNLQFGDRAIMGKIIDVSAGGIFSIFSKKPHMPAVFEKVMVDIKLEKSEKLEGIEGFVIRLQASESFIDAENVKIAIKFLDLPAKRKQEFKRLMNSLNQSAQNGDVA
jgi:hypothetical protein